MDCPHNGIGIDNCAHSEDAGLRCAGKCAPMSSSFMPRYSQVQEGDTYVPLTLLCFIAIELAVSTIHNTTCVCWNY